MAASTACANANAYATVLSRKSRRQLRCLFQRSTSHERLDALVHPTEALLQPHHVFAIGCEAKMARLDDACVHRPDRDLVQPLALGGKEFVRRGLTCRSLFTERMPHVPEAKIEPGPRVGCINRIKPEQITDRAFEPNCGWVARGDTRILSRLQV